MTFGFLERDEKRRRERTIVPRMVCGRVKFLKASCGEIPGEGRLRCSGRDLSGPALNETGSREDDVRLHGSHGESEIFSSRAPRQMHFFWAVPSQRRRLTDSCAHETSCFGAWQLAWPPSRCRAHSSRPPLDPSRKTRGPCRYFWTDVASRMNESTKRRPSMTF